MNQERVTDLLELIEHPEVQQKILGDFGGDYYYVGVTLSPENRGELAIRVRIEGEDDHGIPRQVVLDGHALPVVVNTQFKLPEPLVTMGPRRYWPERRRYRPLYCGLQIANLDDDAFAGGVEKHEINVGTLGCFVELVSGENALLSNNHIIANLNRGQRGKDRIFQFGDEISSADDQVAVLSDFEDIRPSSPGVTDPRSGGVVYNDIDAAVAELCDGIRFRQKYASFRKLAAPSGIGTAMLGERVVKVGCATGLTKGEVEDIGLVPMQGYDHSPCYFRRSIVIKVRGGPWVSDGPQFSDHGDSGSVIVRENGEVVGLLHASNGQQTYACPIEAVMQHFHCTLA